MDTPQNRVRCRSGSCSRLYGTGGHSSICRGPARCIPKNGLLIEIDFVPISSTRSINHYCVIIITINITIASEDSGRDDTEIKSKQTQNSPKCGVQLNIEKKKRQSRKKEEGVKATPNGDTERGTACYKY